ncbi:prolyl 4-Hydroxylase alpha-subunit, region [Oesophagostomum dentatum]|uniref:Prolyl 4-Hydroxylase alpha-subunit, region n=1 Tax=Oesophagostomum dentatum TaxID=61180 RepID=A0A0B1TJ40_OESDE|nr:prolyl 4-Hydroxylase alpha-subunit, region [Oesophagostomum dentatum]
MLASLGLLALLCASANADLFTSMAEMQSLIDSEQAIPTMLYKYIEAEQERLTQLKELAKQYQKKNEKALSVGVDDISNPVNAFLLIKKKIFDWKGLQYKMRSNKADSFIDRMNDVNYGIRYPTEV